MPFNNLLDCSGDRTCVAEEESREGKKIDRKSGLLAQWVGVPGLILVMGPTTSNLGPADGGRVTSSLWYF